MSAAQRAVASVATAKVEFKVRKFDLARVSGLSKRAIEVHLSLYEGYVKESNALLPFVLKDADESPAGRLQSDGLVRRFAFERNGMELHELFFEALRGPSDPPRAGSAFMAAAVAGYGSFESWKASVAKLAQTRGIGWVLTMRHPGDRRLFNVWVDDHTRGLTPNATVVCAFDLWEHAFLIDYQPTQKPQYLQTLFDNLDWQVIDSRCQ